MKQIQFNKFPVKKRFIITDEFKNDAKLYKEEKLSSNDLCNKYGISKTTLREKLMQLGIKMTRRKYGKRKNKKNKPKYNRYFDWSEFKNHIMMKYND